MLVWGVFGDGAVADGACESMPRKYVSKRSCSCDWGGESVALDPTATTGQTVQVQETREKQINSTRECWRARLAVGAGSGGRRRERDSKGSQPEARRVHSVHDDPESNLKGALRRVMFSARVSPEELAVARLAKSIGVKVSRNSSVIDFSCEAKNPRLAQQIPASILGGLPGATSGGQSHAGPLEFFAPAGRSTQKRQLDRRGYRAARRQERIGNSSRAGQQKRCKIN